DVTIFVAVCDQDLGTSTFSCRKITWPLSFPIRAVRRSHSTLSKGDTLPSVKRRWKSSPLARRAIFSVCMGVFKAVRVSAISASAPAVLPPNSWPGRRLGGASLFYYLPRQHPECVCVHRWIHADEGVFKRAQRFRPTPERSR